MGSILVTERGVWRIGGGQQQDFRTPVLEEGHIKSIFNIESGEVNN